MENISTIAAVSTAYGEAGIGIVRMSGPKAFEVLNKVFKSKDKNDIKFIPRHMHYGLVIDPENNEIIDEALSVYMKAPFTYTGEDVCEIQCHGGNISIKKILALLLKEGATLAERGEFTKRAFLNGKMDLTKAEAVIDLIKAKSNKSYDVAISQMEGSLLCLVRELRKEILDILVLLSVNMDYPDEDIEIANYEKLNKDLSGIKEKLNNILKSANEGRILREGLKVAIVGKPNVGKSSLMNIFLKENRSIVTNIPGTTRDTIEEGAVVRGISISFIDTAGIHESTDVVESIGIERSKEAFNKADLLLIILDASKPLEKEDEEILSMANGRPNIVILNKTDLGNNINVSGISTSFKEEKGIKEIEDAIESFVDNGKVRRENDVIISNIRHIELIRKAILETEEALNMIKNKEALDFIEINVKAAFDYLGEITGDTANDEVINEVFSRFCLGK